MNDGWIKQKETIVYTSPAAQALVQTCYSEKLDKTHDFFILKSSDWSNIIPVTADGKVIMVKQYRAGISDFTLEIPGGMIDGSDSDAQDGAIREMVEETGYVPLPGARCTRLGWTHSNPALFNNRCHSFVIGPVTRDRHQKLDSSEMIEIVEVPVAEIPSLILQGKITHALMLNAFLFLGLLSSQNSDALLNELRRFQRGELPVQ